MGESEKRPWRDLIQGEESALFSLPASFTPFAFAPRNHSVSVPKVPAFVCAAGHPSLTPRETSRGEAEVAV